MGEEFKPSPLPRKTRENPCIPKKDSIKKQERRDKEDAQKRKKVEIQTDGQIISMTQRDKNSPREETLSDAPTEVGGSSGP